MNSREQIRVGRYDNTAAVNCCSKSMDISFLDGLVKILAHEVDDAYRRVLLMKMHCTNTRQILTGHICSTRVIFFLLLPNYILFDAVALKCWCI